ncbi:uncharacterized protein [Hyperolius riggenbachi]|uniref:uncharacterized protein isoform X2 n=1 Tax=Hyperolius riggenbachi TaxID=752182 RepID=UPI0035A28925
MIAFLSGNLWLIGQIYEGSMDAEISSPTAEDQAVLTPTQPVFPARHGAGHFEHVAQMNMIDAELLFLRIQPKIRLVNLAAEEQNPPSAAPADHEARLDGNKINVSDPASSKKDEGFKLLSIVRQDLQMSDVEDSELETPKNTSSEKPRKDRRKSPRQKLEKGKARDNSDKENDEDWAKARQKVEQFLDFPALMSALAFRTQTESHGSSPISPTASNGPVASSEAVALLPNTRHNAIFLRDNQEAARVILMS